MAGAKIINEKEINKKINGSIWEPKNAHYFTYVM